MGNEARLYATLTNFIMNGYLALLLTAHVPYVRTAGRQPIGEDLLHETIAYAIVPTINVLCDLREQRIPLQLALAYSPVLLEQLNDNIVQKHFVVWMEQWLARVAEELVRCERSGETHRAYLAQFYLNWGQNILQSFVGRYGRNLVAVLRELCDDGEIEPLAGAATHAYLPLLDHPTSIRAQLDIGNLTVTKRLGGPPRGLWLPECGYHPQLEQHIIATETRYFIADPASITIEPPTGPLRPLWVAPRRLAVFIRDVQTAHHVWSFNLGYPGDPLYLAPQREMPLRLACWRNGISTTSERELYDPYHAFRRAQEHAAHFSAVVGAKLTTFNQRHKRPGIVVIPLDAELLGRSWFEGPTWLRALIEQLTENPSVELSTPAAYLRMYQPRQEAMLHEGSWGVGGDHHSWFGAASFSLGDALHEAEEQVALLSKRFPHANGVQERLLTQAGRELLLAQSSDWLLLLSQHMDIQEALDRPAQHLHRCQELCRLAEQVELSDNEHTFLETIEELDNPFPNLNYRVFTSV